MGIPHFPFDFRTGNQSRNRVHNNNINGAAAYHSFCDFQCLFAVVRLGNIQIVNIYTQSLCISRVHSMFRVDVARNAATFLHFRYHMQSNGCFTRRFRTIYFDDSALRHTAHAQSDIQTQGACGNHFHVHFCAVVTQFHYGTFAELFFNLAQSRVQCFLFIFKFDFVFAVFCFCCCHAATTFPNKSNLCSHFTRFHRDCQPLFFVPKGLLPTILPQKSGYNPHTPEGSAVLHKVPRKSLPQK